MQKFRHRSPDREIMDDLTCKGQVVAQTLKELDIINKSLSGNSVSLNGLSVLLSRHNSAVIKVADLGCGSGGMIREFIQWADKNNKHLELYGIDANPFIMDCARNNLKGFRNVFLCHENVLNREFAKQRFDVIHCSLFLHHFTKEELVLLFSNFKTQAKFGFVVNDLHRHWLAYYAIKLLTRLFSQSAMVRFDAPLSVRKGFRKSELEAILKEAGVSNYRLKWKWAFRWQLVFSNT